MKNLTGFLNSERNIFKGSGPDEGSNLDISEEALDTLISVLSSLKDRIAKK